MSKPKFKAGDSVTVSGGPGEITEVAEHDAIYLKSGGEQLYSVRLAPWKREEFQDKNGNTQVQFRHPRTGETRGHEADTLGCVPESSLKAR